MSNPMGAYIKLMPLVEYDKLKFFFDKDVNLMTKKLDKIKAVYKRAKMKEEWIATEILQSPHKEP